MGQQNGYMQNSMQVLQITCNLISVYTCRISGVDDYHDSGVTVLSSFIKIMF